MRSHQYRAEWDNHLLWLINDAVPDAPRTWLALLATRAQWWLNLPLTRTPRTLSAALLSNLSFSSVYTQSQLSHVQVENPALVLVKPHISDECPALWFVWVFLKSLSTLKGVDSSSQFGVTGKLIPLRPIFKSWRKMLKSTGLSMKPAEPH